jgi:CRP/FNR family transcriptional regulator, cyclic AMP receptor protein
MASGSRRRRPKRRRDEKLERLSEVSLFSGCTKRELNLIARSVDEIDAPAGKVLIRQGDAGRECFVIVEGRATAAIRGKGTYPMGPGACFGEMSLLDSELRAATVTADSDMKLLVLSSREFSKLVTSVPTVGLRVMASLAQRLRGAERSQPHH